MSSENENTDKEKVAVKYDQDKPRYDLIPAMPLHDLALVYTMGCAKYAARNWEKGLDWMRVFGALMRHSWAWLRGETFDPESGLHHMAHAAWSCLALVEYHYTKKGEDDRPYEQKIDHYKIFGTVICNHGERTCVYQSTNETGGIADQSGVSDSSERIDLRNDGNPSSPLGTE